MHYAIFEKSTGKVLEIAGSETASKIIMHAYNGTATRARCNNREFIAYSHGQEIKAETIGISGGKAVIGYEII